MADHGVNLDALAESGDTAGVQLALAARSYHQQDLSYALALAAINGHAQCVELLIPVSDPLTDDSAALRGAAGSGHAQCVALLIPVSDPLADDSKALRWAAQYGHASCVELLIPVSDPLADDNLALRCAAREAHAQCVALLLPVSGIKKITRVAREAQKKNHPEIAAMMESFMEAKTLSDSCSKKDRVQGDVGPVNRRGLSL